jgi:ankyrin repeat protein
MLIDRKIDLNVQNDDGDTALMLVVKKILKKM